MENQISLQYQTIDQRMQRLKSSGQRLNSKLIINQGKSFDKNRHESDLSLNIKLDITNQNERISQRKVGITKRGMWMGTRRIKNIQKQQTQENMKSKQNQIKRNIGKIVKNRLNLTSLNIKKSQQNMNFI